VGAQCDSDGDTIGDACETSGGHVRVTLRVTGTGDVAGVQSDITHPATVTLNPPPTSNQVTNLAGFGFVNANAQSATTTRVVAANATNLFVAPDDAYSVTFAYTGAAPLLTDFGVSNCVITAESGTNTTAGCQVTNLVLLP